MTQKCKTAAAMEAKNIIEPELENRKVVITTCLDVKWTFEAVLWPSILKGLKDSGFPRNLYYLSQGYFSQRTAVISTNSVCMDRSVTKYAHKDHEAGLDSGICFTFLFLNWNSQVTQKQ
jgi:hypothetical protein